MARTIIVDGAERVACPKCNHGFALSEGISRQAIDLLQRVRSPSGLARLVLH